MKQLIVILSALFLLGCVGPTIQRTASGWQLTTGVLGQGTAKVGDAETAGSSISEGAAEMLQGIILPAIEMGCSAIPTCNPQDATHIHAAPE